MANTYNFRINAVDVHTVKDDLEKVIYNVHWTYIAENEDGVQAHSIGTQALEAPSAESFVSFDQLIQDDIIAWIEPLIEVENMQIRLDNQIQEQVQPTKQTLRVPVSLEEEATTEETV